MKTRFCCSISQKKINESSECIFGEVSGLGCEWADCVECGKTYGGADHWGTPRTEAATDSYWEISSEDKIKKSVKNNIL